MTSRLEFTSSVPGSREDLFAWHTRPGAFDRLKPPWQQVEMPEPAPVANGSRALLRLKKGPVWVSWLAEHRDVEEPNGFTDFQVRGPFASWTHRHEFTADGTGGAKLSDRIEYALPGGALGHLIAGRSVARDIESTFAYRHATTARDLARHARFSGSPGLRVAITGASGLIGQSLLPFLSTGGHKPLAVGRTGSGMQGSANLRWTPDAGLLEPEEIAPFDALVHLAGENVAAGRWTRARKSSIRESRVDGTRNLVRSLGRLETPPKMLVCASAIGYFGSRGDRELDESSAAGDGFLAETSRDWEAAAREAEKLGIRVVQLRFGVVLTPAGGALAKLLTPFRMGGGGKLGSGRQYMSWVSIDDAIGAIHAALLDDSLAGPVNVVSPEPVTNRTFTKTLGRILSRPTILPLPASAARLLFGEMADEMLLASTRVVPARLERSGFVFDDPNLGATLERLLGAARLP